VRRGKAGFKVFALPAFSRRIWRFMGETAALSLRGMREIFFFFCFGGVADLAGSSASSGNAELRQKPLGENEPGY
jgi:hypothetical protein